MQDGVSNTVVQQLYGVWLCMYYLPSSSLREACTCATEAVLLLLGSSSPTWPSNQLLQLTTGNTGQAQEP